MFDTSFVSTLFDPDMVICRDLVKFSGYFLCLMTSHDPWESLATSGMASHHQGGGKIPAPGDTMGDDSEMGEEGGDP